jgi:hypothetical protein
LSPVILDELLSDQLRGDGERFAAVIARLNRDVRQREQEGILVGGYELTLGQQSLEVGQKLELLLGSWFAHEEFSQYTALSGMTHRMPPRGSGTSPRNRGMMWTRA